MGPRTVRTGAGDGSGVGDGEATGLAEAVISGSVDVKDSMSGMTINKHSSATLSPVVVEVW
jgi:hypothetical protein